jgi:hypothetical protein
MEQACTVGLMAGGESGYFCKAAEQKKERLLASEVGT